MELGWINDAFGRMRVSLVISYMKKPHTVSLIMASTVCTLCGSVTFRRQSHSLLRCFVFLTMMKREEMDLRAGSKAETVAGARGKSTLAENTYVQ